MTCSTLLRQIHVTLMVKSVLILSGQTVEILKTEVNQNHVFVNVLFLPDEQIQSPL